MFTRQGGGGNHLGVVTDPAGLSDAAMQRLAADLGFSETVFVARGSDAPTVRIFTPSAELSFAGHPLVGAAWVLRVVQGTGDDRIVCGAGEMGIRLDDDTVWIDIPSGWMVRPDRADRPAWVEVVDRSVVEMSVPYVLAEAADPAVVAEAPPPPTGWGDAVMLWSRHQPGSSVKARFFAGGLGVAEDPATGSAAVALAALLSERGSETGRLTILQGDEIGHPSAILLDWSPGRISIGGTVSYDRWVEVAG